MKSLFGFLRYGSCTFFYLISSFIVLSLSTKLCNNIISVISFIIFSLTILPIVIKEERKSEISKKGLFNKSLSVFTLLSLSTFETGYILYVFRASSDNASTAAGAFVFATIIFTVAFVCAIFGSYTAIKLSNIIFVIPSIALALSLLCYLKSGISLEIFRTVGDSDVYLSIISGFSASVLTFSDVYIVTCLQKSEKCFYPGYSRYAYCFALIIIVTFTIAYKTIFGIEISKSLSSPMMSCLGIITGSGLKEIFPFIFSVSLLYRMLCRMCFLLQLLSNMKHCKLLCAGLFLVAVNTGALFSVFRKFMLPIGVLSLFLSFITFLLMPIIPKITSFRISSDN